MGLAVETDQPAGVHRVPIAREGGVPIDVVDEPVPAESADRQALVLEIDGVVPDLRQPPGASSPSMLVSESINGIP